MDYLSLSPWPFPSISPHKPWQWGSLRHLTACILAACPAGASLQPGSGGREGCWLLSATCKKGKLESNPQFKLKQGEEIISFAEIFFSSLIFGFLDVEIKQLAQTVCFIYSLCLVAGVILNCLHLFVC